MASYKRTSSLFDFCTCKAAQGVLGVYDQSSLNEDGLKNDDVRKGHVVMLLSSLGNTVDVSEFDSHNLGIGCNELRFLYLNNQNEPEFESNIEHNYSTGDDNAHAVYLWEQLTPYEKCEVEDFLMTTLIQSRLKGK